MVVTWPLHLFCTSISLPIHRKYIAMINMFPGLYNGVVTRSLYRGYIGITCKLYGYYIHLIRAVLEYYIYVIWELHMCYFGVTYTCN